MLFPDANACLAAMRPDSSPDAVRVRSWLEEALNGHEQEALNGYEQVGLSELVLSAVVRPGARHWAIFRDLVSTHRLRANDVPDAYLAALAMEVGATFVTLDRGFGRFSGLRCIDPTAD